MLTRVFGGSGGGGSSAAHSARDTLVHSLAEPAHTEIEYNADMEIIRVTHWTDVSMTTKIRETLLSYNAEGCVSTSESTQFDDNGIAVESLSYSYTYDADGCLTSVDTEVVSLSTVEGILDTSGAPILDTTSSPLEGLV